MTQVAQGIRSPAVEAALKAAFRDSPYSQNQIAKRLGKNRRKQLWLWEHGGGITLENAYALEEAAGLARGTVANIVRLELEREAAERLAADYERKREALHRKHVEDE